MHFHQLAAGKVGASGFSADDVFLLMLLVLLVLVGLSSARVRLSVSIIIVSAVFNGWLSATVRRSREVLVVVVVWSDIFISPLLLFLCATNFRCLESQLGMSRRKVRVYVYTTGYLGIICLAECPC